MDQLQSLIDRIGMQNLLIGGGVLVGFFILRAVWNMAKPKPEPAGARASCSCGWAGRASRYKPRCPKCGKEPTFEVGTQFRT